MWEAGGGHLEPGETPFEAACREWAEEVGCEVPLGQVVSMWQSEDGVYQGFVLSVPHEADVPINLDYPRVENPDAPLHAKPETTAWFHIDHLPGMPGLRTELARDLERVLPALRAPVRKLAKGGKDPDPHKGPLENKVHDYLRKHYPESTTEWVCRSAWEKNRVPLSRIAYHNRPGGRDPEKVDRMREKLEEGWKPDRVVLVDPGSQGKMVVADGYHRLLAMADDEDTEVKAFVGTPRPGAGDWRRDILAMQREVLNAAGPEDK